MYKRVNELLGTEYNSDSEINWTRISQYQDLSESFIREFKDYVSWSNISSGQVLSESFIKEFKDKVDWEYISQFQSLSESFIREFKDRVDWWYISKYQILSWNFILEFEDYVDWNCISLHQPFIIDLGYKKLNQKFLKQNKLFSLYQQTKENGWFIGYLNNNSNFFELDTSFFFDFINYTKLRIYWKDFISVIKNRKKIYEPIRQIKHV